MNSERRLVSERFPRSSQYQPEWVLASASGGANALWLTEWFTSAMELRPGMRVLDLGCGRASSSIFLRREFGAQVWAADLCCGINPTKLELEESFGRNRREWREKLKGPSPGFLVLYFGLTTGASSISLRVLVFTSAMTKVNSSPSAQANPQPRSAGKKYSRSGAPLAGSKA